MSVLVDEECSHVKSEEDRDKVGKCVRNLRQSTCWSVKQVLWIADTHMGALGLGGMTPTLPLRCCFRKSGCHWPRIKQSTCWSVKQMLWVADAHMGALGLGRVTPTLPLHCHFRTVLHATGLCKKLTPPLLLAKQRRSGPTTRQSTCWSVKQVLSCEAGVLRGRVALGDPFRHLLDISWREKHLLFSQFCPQGQSLGMRRVILAPSRWWVEVQKGVVGLFACFVSWSLSSKWSTSHSR
jgi:hypothetical protein